MARFSESRKVPSSKGEGTTDAPDFTEIDKRLQEVGRQEGAIHGATGEMMLRCSMLGTNIPMALRQLRRELSRPLADEVREHLEEQYKTLAGKLSVSNSLLGLLFHQQSQVSPVRGNRGR